VIPPDFDAYPVFHFEDLVPAITRPLRPQPILLQHLPHRVDHRAVQGDALYWTIHFKNPTHKPCSGISLPTS
jgi:hypothetical protein